MQLHRESSLRLANTVVEADAFSRLARRWRSTYVLLLKAWRFKQSDLEDAAALLRCRLAALERVRAQSADVDFAVSEPIDELWMLFLGDATPGTRMWKEAWRAEPRIQRLTIADLLVAFASAKLDATVEVLTRPISRSASEVLKPEFALALAAGHLDAAEEALKLARGLVNTPGPSKK
ncbi:MAG TPA: hypothetical protein VNM24_07080 [Burkholderiales bacterium]|nr:hypothetical protein [Burkholderiales bacterium]